LHIRWSFAKFWHTGRNISPRELFLPFARNAVQFNEYMVINFFPNPVEKIMKTFLCLIACLLLLGCGSENNNLEKTAVKTVQEATKVATQNMTVEPATRNVSCGCALKEVGHCGNYIEINSKYIEIANREDLGLGAMEWCGQTGVQAESAGEIQDGKFVAATLVIK